MPTTSSRNDTLHQALLDATGLETRWTSDARANPFGWLLLETPAQLKEAAKALCGKVRLCTITAYAMARDDDDKRRRIAYHFADGDTVLTVTVPLFDPETNEKLPVPSITPWFRNADWNEREFREMFNIDIPDHPNPKRLFLDERLDAGIMTKLIPFSAMANSAGTNMLWERILEAKGVPPEERLPSLATPAEPIKVEPAVTPVEAAGADSAESGAAEKPKRAAGTTLADMALSPEAFAEARAREKAAIAEAEAAYAQAEDAYAKAEAARARAEAAKAELKAVEVAAAQAEAAKAAETSPAPAEEPVREPAPETSVAEEANAPEPAPSGPVEPEVRPEPVQSEAPAQAEAPTPVEAPVKAKSPAPKPDKAAKAGGKAAAKASGKAPGKSSAKRGKR